MLLMITQKIDAMDHTLGFMVGWLRAFAREYSSVLVICLEQGVFDLPSNVKVRSLGKETGRSRLKYLWRFYRYLWQERKNYETVLVHMNQEYILLAGWWWRLTGKEIWLWRNHRYGNLLTDLAVIWSHRVFCTSPDAYVATAVKTSIMPVGVDTNLFRRHHRLLKQPNSILYLGRISKIKDLELLIKALVLVDNLGGDFILNIVGDPTEADKDYSISLKISADHLVAKKKINFLSGVSHEETVDFYNQHQLLVNLTPSGSFDKVILEAMACESLVLTTNNTLRNVVPSIFLVTSSEPTRLAEKIQTILQLSVEQMSQYGRDFRQYVVVNHSLLLLARMFK